MRNGTGWNPLRSGRAAALWGAGIAAAAIGGVLWNRRPQRQSRARGSTTEDDAAGRIADALSRLIATCMDGEQGFETAAEGVTDPQVKSLFHQFARQRRDLRLELESMTSRWGGAPRPTGSVA